MTQIILMIEINKKNRSQKAVSAYISTSKQIVPFGFAEQNCPLMNKGVKMQFFKLFTHNVLECLL